MKIVVIMGSPRKGNTYRACEEFREHLQKTCPAEFEYIWLKDSRIEPCRGCFACFPGGEDKCPCRDDDVRLIEQKMLGADGVIFATPVYSVNVTGQMKTFIDRISYNGHRPQFFGKKAFFLVTTGILGAGEVLDYLEKLTHAWGFEPAGKAGLITPNGPVPPDRAEKNTRVLEKGAAKYSASLLRKKQKSPGPHDVIYFYCLKGTFSGLEKISPADYRFWKNRGWLSPGAHYFTCVPVNPLYRAAGKFFEIYSKRSNDKNYNL